MNKCNKKPFAYYIEVCTHGDKSGQYVMQTQECQSAKDAIKKFSELISFVDKGNLDVYLMGMYGTAENYDIESIKKITF